MEINGGDNNIIKANLKTEILKDKKVTRDELKKLTPAEQEDLIKGLTNEDGTIEKGFTIEGKPATQPVVEEEGLFKKTFNKFKKWFENPEVPKLAKAGALLVGVGAGALVAGGVGAAVAAAGGVGAVLTGAAGVIKTLAPLLVGGAALGLASCSNDLIGAKSPDYNISSNTSVSVTVNANSENSEILKNLEELLKEAKNITQILEEFEKGKIDGDRLFEILRELLDKSEENNKVQDDIKNLLRVICTQLENQGNDINEILTELQDKGAVLKDILVALKENGKTLDDIYNALLNQGKTQEQIVTLLLAIGEDVTNIKDMLYNMGKSNDEILDLLKGIYGNTTQILGTNQEILDKLNEVAGKIANGDKVEFEDLKPIIEAAVSKLIETYNGGNQEVLKALNEILNKIPNGCKCDPTQILAKLEIIITELQNGNADDPRHEGILDDLEDLLG